MLDALRRFADRPLRDGERLRLFLSTVALLVGVALVLTVVDDGPSRLRAAAPSPTSTPAAPAAPAATPDARGTATPEAAPSEEGEGAAATPASRAQVRAAKRAARRFLGGYLAFSYGRGRARAIRGVSDELRHELVQSRPRVPRDVRKRRPRVRLVQSDGVGPRAAALTAVVEDGKGPLHGVAQLARPAGEGWTVTAVES